MTCPEIVDCQLAIGDCKRSQSAISAVLLLACLCSPLLHQTTIADPVPPVRTVFIILMENHVWADIKGSPSAPYINTTLLPMASHCEQYYNPPGIHPSLPNYLWLEAGTNFGIMDDNDPSADHQNSTNHLVTLLNNAGITWKTYQEGITGTYVPLTNYYGYAPRHCPFVYFDDVTGTNNPGSAYGMTHIRPYYELAADLNNNHVARYNFITPDTCHDMHDVCSTNQILQGDSWLSSEVPKILQSQAFSNDGVLFIVWDEGEYGSDGPLGMIVLSPLARGGGYFNSIHYDHASTLRTCQEIFGVGPWLGMAENATDLSDLFGSLRILSVVGLSSNGLQLSASGLIPQKTIVLQSSSDLSSWISIATNMPPGNSATFIDTTVTNAPQRFYRLLQQ